MFSFENRRILNFLPAKDHVKKFVGEKRRISSRVETIFKWSERLMMSLVSFLTIFSFCHLNRFESFFLSAHTIGTEQGMCRQKETCISAPSKKHKSNWKEIPKIPIHCYCDFCCVKERFPFIKQLQLRDDIRIRWDGSNSIKADRGPQSKNLIQRLHGSDRESFAVFSDHPRTQLFLSLTINDQISVVSSSSLSSFSRLWGFLISLGS